jgi:hypothetical protein
MTLALRRGAQIAAPSPRLAGEWLAMTRERERARKTGAGRSPAGGLVVDSPQDEGCPPIPYSPPKIEDPPQEEWGSGG